MFFWITHLREGIIPSRERRRFFTGGFSLSGMEKPPILPSGGTTGDFSPAKSRIRLDVLRHSNQGPRKVALTVFRSGRSGSPAGTAHWPKGPQAEAIRWPKRRSPLLSQLLGIPGRFHGQMREGVWPAAGRERPALPRAGRRDTEAWWSGVRGAKESGARRGAGPRGVHRESGARRGAGARGVHRESDARRARATDARGGTGNRHPRRHGCSSTRADPEARESGPRGGSGNRRLKRQWGRRTGAKGSGAGRSTGTGAGRSTAACARDNGGSGARRARATDGEPREIEGGAHALLNISLPSAVSSPQKREKVIFATGKATGTTGTTGRAVVCRMESRTTEEKERSPQRRAAAANLSPNERPGR